MSGFGFFAARCLTESAWKKVRAVDISQTALDLTSMPQAMVESGPTCDQRPSETGVFITRSVLSQHLDMDKLDVSRNL